MNKTQLLEKARSLGLEVTEDHTKSQLEKLIADKEAETTVKEPYGEQSFEEQKASFLKEGIYLDERGRKYTFTKDAPKQLNIDGAPMTQKEILETEEVIAELVLGNNGFITQVNDG